MNAAGLLAGTRVMIVGGGGAPGGIGHEVTMTMARAGADLAVVDLDPARAQAAAQEAAELGSKAIALAGDVCDGDSVESMVAESRAGLGGIDVLVTVVGGLMAWRVPFHRLHECPDDEWDLVFEVNLRYVFRVTRAVLGVMVEQGTGGAIVSLGSDAGTAGHASPMMAAYGAAKAGLAHLTKTIAAEYGGDGIRMNLVSPGATRTTSTVDLPSPEIAAMEAVIPLGHRGRPVDVANAVLFLASPLAAHVTGQILGVDGGISVQTPMPDLSGIWKQR